MSRSTAGVVTALLVVSVLASSAIGGAAAQEDMVAIEIAVVDADGDPVGNIDLSITWDNGDGGPKNVTTTSNGKQYVDVPKGSDITIQAHDDEYVRNQPANEYNVRGGEVEVSVARSGRATLTVLGPNGPVDGADIEVSPADSVSTADELTTDADGQVTTRRLEQGQYDLEVTKPGYYTNRTTLSLTADRVNRTISLELGQEEVNFEVVDTHFEPPTLLDNATVRVPKRGYSSTTYSGQASTGLPVNQDYEVIVSKPGYKTVRKQFSVGEQPKTVRIAISKTAGLNIDADPDRVVVGESTDITVTDEYGEPVANARVSLAGETVGRTDAAGTLEVPISSAGEMTITVQKSGLSASVTVEGVASGSDETPTPATPTPATPTPTAEETTDEETDGGAGGSGPGFGVLAALAALGAIVLFARYR